MPSLTMMSPEVVFAIEKVREAALLADTIRQEMAGQSMTKNDRSPVTVADFSAQALVGAGLAEKFPKDVLVGEESAAPLRDAEGKETLAKVTHYVQKIHPSATPEKICEWIDRGLGEPKGRYWVMDPIDGTKGFLRGDQYAVALALIENGEILLGILGCPNLKEAQHPDANGQGSLVLGIRGQGSWHRPLKSAGEWKKLSVSSNAKAEETVLLRSFEASHTDSPKMTKIMKTMNIHKPAILMDSLAKYTLVASGKADLLIRLRAGCSEDQGEYIWDQASGVLIVEEAGGRVTDLDGKKLDFTAGKTLCRNRGVLISNGRVHSAALEAIKTLERE